MSDSEYLDALEQQRRHFEAQFGSIESLGFEDKVKEKIEEAQSSASGSSDEDEAAEIDQDMDSEDDSEENSDDSSGDEFGGFSDDEDLIDYSDKYTKTKDSSTVDKKSRNGLNSQSTVKLVDNYTGKSLQVSKRDKKILSSGRAATLVEIEKREAAASKMTAKQQQQAAKEDNDNLENDVKLQRLLSESHILAGNNEMSGADLTLQTLDYEEPTGKARRRTLDSRIRQLSLTNAPAGTKARKLENMPMHMRKGMIKSHDEKVRRYEEEARNAGIILHKVKKGERRQLDSGRGSTSAIDRIGNGITKKAAAASLKKRDRGLKISLVGRSTRNGLVILADEISRINGQGRQGKNGKGKSKRGRR